MCEGTLEFLNCSFVMLNQLMHKTCAIFTKHNFMKWHWKLNISVKVQNVCFLSSKEREVVYFLKPDNYRTDRHISIAILKYTTAITPIFYHVIIPSFPWRWEDTGLIPDHAMIRCKTLYCKFPCFTLRVQHNRLQQGWMVKNDWKKY